MKKKLTLLLALIMIVFLTSCKKNNRSINPITSDDELSLTLYSHNGKGEGKFLIKSFGHTFLALKNNSSSSVYLLDYELKPNEEITFGAWGIDDHYGVWFNLEAMYQHKANRYSGIASITAGVDISKLDAINELIKENDTWTFTHNCSYLALTIWNECVDSNEKIKRKKLNSPSYVYDVITSFDDALYDREMMMQDYSFTYLKGKMLKYDLEEKAYA